MTLSSRTQAEGPPASPGPAEFQVCLFHEGRLMGMLVAQPHRQAWAGGCEEDMAQV